MKKNTLYLYLTKKTQMKSESKLSRRKRNVKVCGKTVLNLTKNKSYSKSVVKKEFSAGLFSKI